MEIKFYASEEEKEIAKKNVLEKMREVSDKEFSILEDYILNGYKETLSNLLIYIGKERSSSLLEKLPPELSKELSSLLEKSEVEKPKGKEEPVVMAEVGHILRMSGYFGETTFDDIFETLDNKSKFILSEVAKEFMRENPILALNVDLHRFEFEDIVMLDDRAIQKILRECDYIEVAKALKGASNEVQDKIFRNMSKRAGAMLKEDMEFMGPVRFCDIQEAQERIIKMIKRLEDSGEIVIVRDTGTMLVE